MLQAHRRDSQYEFGRVDCPYGRFLYKGTKLGKAESKVRYSLVVSIETPNVDIYTLVLIQIKTRIPVQV